MKRQLLLISCLIYSLGALADRLPPGPSPEVVGSDVGYKTVAKALAALRAKKDVSFSTVKGWSIATDEAQLIVWSFSPPSDPSYPSVVKRMVVSNGTGSAVTLKVLCESTRASCETLIREFSGKNLRGAAAPHDH